MTVNNMLESLWKEPAVIISTYYSRIYPEELGQITKILSDFGVLAGFESGTSRFKSGDLRCVNMVYDFYVFYLDINTL